jgi:polyhydroxybutyrate depolymerase
LNEFETKVMKQLIGFTIFLYLLIPDLHAQVVSASVFHDGIARSYLTYVPTTWTTTSNMPLLFVLHGTSQNGQGIMDISEFNAIAENNGFLVVYPDGIGGSWNTGIAGGSGADDLGLIDTLVQIHQAQYGVDESRVFACGFSAGGYMSYRLACESSRCFAGVASVAGTMTGLVASNCNPQFITPVIHIHGDADFIVAFNGSAIAGISVDSVLSIWNAANSCPVTPVITARPNTNLLDFSTVDEWTYSPCAVNTQNVLLKVNNGGHQWPGTNVVLGGIGVINRDIDASEEIWNFFSGLDCDNLTTSVAAKEEDVIRMWYDKVGRTLHFEGLSGVAAFYIYNAQGALEATGNVSDSEPAYVGGLGAGFHLVTMEGWRRWKFVR